MKFSQAKHICMFKALNVLNHVPSYINITCFSKCMPNFSKQYIQINADKFHLQFLRIKTMLVGKPGPHISLHFSGTKILHKIPTANKHLLFWHQHQTIRYPTIFNSSNHTQFLQPHTHLSGTFFGLEEYFL